MSFLAIFPNISGSLAEGIPVPGRFVHRFSSEKTSPALIFAVVTMLLNAHSLICFSFELGKSTR